MSSIHLSLPPISKCRACNLKRLEKILFLGSQYLSDFTKSNIKPEKFPLELVLCKSCNLLQLRHTSPASSLYTKRYGYRSGINDTMKRELKEIVNQALDNIRHTGDKIYVLDIGANDGTLLSNYKKNVIRIGVEPIKKFVKECRLHADIVINDFFSYKSYTQKVKDKKAHIITAISCFYDIEDPNKFLSDVKKVLAQDGVFIIQQNYLLSMLQNNAFDNIVHEHLEYYSLLSLENLLKRHDLEIFDVYLTEINGGSFRTLICHKGERKISDSIFKLREKEKKFKLSDSHVYKEFAQRVEKNKNDIFAFTLGLVKQGKKIYIYGASTRGNTLIQYFNLGKNVITAAVERNPEKWGKKIASMGIPIISESQARKEKPDYMLVLPWFFKEEFLKREMDYLNRGGHFIFPLPQLEII